MQATWDHKTGVTKVTEHFYEGPASPFGPHDPSQPIKSPKKIVSQPSKNNPLDGEIHITSEGPEAGQMHVAHNGTWQQVIHSTTSTYTEREVVSRAAAFRWKPTPDLVRRWKDLPKEEWVQHLRFDRTKNGNGQTLQSLTIITKLSDDTPFMEVGLIRNETTGDVIYVLDGEEISCSTMRDILYSILPALECLPLSIVEGPFKELDELLRRDSSIEEKDKHSRFDNLEIEDDGSEDTSGDSETITTGNQEG
jgi:hypothetical protein